MPVTLTQPANVLTLTVLQVFHQKHKYYLKAKNQKPQIFLYK